MERQGRMSRVSGGDEVADGALEGEAVGVRECECRVNVADGTAHLPKLIRTEGWCCLKFRVRVEPRRRSGF